MIFLSGVHGVGKSYFCEQIKRKIDIETYTASELISAEKEEFFSSDKYSKDIDDNQQHLLNAVRKLDSKEGKYLLDGHFCLLNENGQITRINSDTFINLSPSAIILLTEAPEVIVGRRKARDNVNCSVDEITVFQNEEIAYAKEIANLLSVKLIILHRADDLNAIVDFIRNL